VVTGGLVLGLVGVSSAAVLTTIALGDPPLAELALAIAFWRCLGGALALAPFAWRARRRHPVTRGDARLLAVSGVFLAVHFALFLGSLAYTTVASSTTLATTAPVFVALGGLRFLGERPIRRTWIGMGVSMLGALALGVGDLTDVALGPQALLGDVFALLSAVSVAGYFLIGRSVRPRVHASTYSGGVYGAAAAVLLVACLLVGVPLTDFSTTQWFAVAGIIIGPQLLGHTVFNTLLSSVPAATVSVVVLAEPVLATLLALVVLGQVPATLYWFAAPVVLAGLLVAVRGRRRLPAAVLPA
jgi:drug/metabolite transporter (DMT)-like permease